MKGHHLPQKALLAQKFGYHSEAHVIFGVALGRKKLVHHPQPKGFGMGGQIVELLGGLKHQRRLLWSVLTHDIRRIVIN